MQDFRYVGPHSSHIFYFKKKSENCPQPGRKPTMYLNQLGGGTSLHRVYLNKYSLKNHK